MGSQGGGGRPTRLAACEDLLAKRAVRWGQRFEAIVIGSFEKRRATKFPFHRRIGKVFYGTRCSSLLALCGKVRESPRK